MDNLWVKGDLSGLEIPTDIHSLVEGGTEFLTAALRHTGALDDDNQVTRINQAEETFGGGTGAKMLLTVEYQNAGHKKGETELPDELFVKFSRNYNDPIRDSVSQMMVPEVKFAALSGTPGFPIIVPQCLFADIEAASGSGLMITERLAFGKNGVSPLYNKCMDYQVSGPLEHYQSVIAALGDLAGAHKSGHLDPSFDQELPFDRTATINADPIRYPLEKLLRRSRRIVEFTKRHPQLFPENLLQQDFHQRFLQEVPFVAEREQLIKQFLYSNHDYIALCHWNANIDNGWYWRDKNGQLQCGLMDWGRVGQMSVAQTIYGSLSGAEKPLWDEHLENLLELFISHYNNSGGPLLQLEELRRHTLLVTITMGLAYLMDAPAIIERSLPDLADTDSSRDQQFVDNEDARVQLHMLTMFLNQWQRNDIMNLVKQVTE